MAIPRAPKGLIAQIVGALIVSTIALIMFIALDDGNSASSNDSQTMVGKKESDDVSSVRLAYIGLGCHIIDGNDATYVLAFALHNAQINDQKTGDKSGSSEAAIYKAAQGGEELARVDGGCDIWRAAPQAGLIRTEATLARNELEALGQPGTLENASEPLVSGNPTIGPENEGLANSSGQNWQTVDAGHGDEVTADLNSIEKRGTTASIIEKLESGPTRVNYSCPHDGVLWTVTNPETGIAETASQESAEYLVMARICWGKDTAAFPSEEAEAGWDNQPGSSPQSPPH